MRKINHAWRQRGLVTIIYILIVALIATFVLIIAQSRLFLSLERSKSASDSLIASYRAESEINDAILRLANGTLTDSDFARFPTTRDLGGGFTLTLDGEIDGNKQILTATAKRSFAVSKIQAVRARAQASEVSEVDLVLMLDCTGSMVDVSRITNTSILEEQTRAVRSFIESLRDHPNGDFFHVGIGVFGIDAAWLKTANGVEIRPDNNIPFSTILASIDSGFGRYPDYKDENGRPSNDGSSACQLLDRHGGTNIGLGFAHAEKFLETRTANKPVIVLTTDGRPNIRTPDAACPPSFYCAYSPDGCQIPKYGWACTKQGNFTREECAPEGTAYMKCRLADTNNGGVRDPKIDTYSVTVFDKPYADAAKIFEDHSKMYFPATRASEMTEILDRIFDEVISSVSTTTISRVIPLEE